MTNTLMSIDDVAKYLNISISTIRRWLKSGKLIGKKVGSQWRFDPNSVMEAYNNETLSDSIPDSDSKLINQIYEIPNWAKPIIKSWKNHYNECVQTVKPDHVVVIDRRGAKIWELINDGKFLEGKNLWHSTIFDFLTKEEAKNLFNNKNILLFDEMMQYGRKMYLIREKLESFGSHVTSAVCIRRKSYAESGKLLEKNAIVFEDLNDKQFSEKAEMISRLLNISSPPLDSDHFIINSRFRDDLSIKGFINNLSKYGIVTLIRYPDSEYNLFAITLDRPQFFNSNFKNEFKNFDFNWNHPCKIRFYINQHSKQCSCTFIAFPKISAPENAWRNLSGTNDTDKIKNKTNQIWGGDTDKDLNNEELRRRFSSIYLELSLFLFRDFILSGAMNNAGLIIHNINKIIEKKIIKAVYGSQTSLYIQNFVEHALKTYKSEGGLFQRDNNYPLSLHIRQAPSDTILSNNLFDCRQEIVKKIPKKNSNMNDKVASLQYLIHKLVDFSEPTIGKAIDYEIDWGVIKPNLNYYKTTAKNEKIITVERIFSRGEYGPCFDFNELVTTHENISRRRTVVMGPIVVEKFLRGIEEPKLKASQFAKIFANLLHDWDLRNAKYDSIWLGWVPYMFGPLPIVPKKTTFGDYQRYENFLMDWDCIIETREKHGTKYWNRYKPNYNSHIPWKEIYNSITDATLRARISGLIRAYSVIQTNLKTKRLSSPNGTKYSIFQDPLIVLGAARNNRIAYISGWFEVTDWLQKGEFVFDQIEAMSLVEKKYDKPHLNIPLKNFSIPARLLFDKIQMYQNLPYLRKQLSDLAEKSNLDYLDVILESTDHSPKIISHSQYPIKKLEWACSVMRLFSSFTRQLMTSCGLERKREIKNTDDKKIKIDANYYANKLIRTCEQLNPFGKNIQIAISETKKGILSSNTAELLTTIFSTISKLFESEIPDPRPQFERDRDKIISYDGLLTRFNSIQFPEPYAIAVLDIKNIRHLTLFSEYLGGTNDEVMNNILNKVENDAKSIVSTNTDVKIGGLSGDCIIFVGPNADVVLSCVYQLIDVTTNNLYTTDNRIMPFGLFRAGISWYQSSLGDNYMGAQPGLTAYEIGDRHRNPAGTICVSQAIFDRLSSKNKVDFINTQLNSKQGKVYSTQRNFIEQ